MLKCTYVFDRKSTKLILKILAQMWYCPLFRNDFK